MICLVVDVGIVKTTNYHPVRVAMPPVGTATVRHVRHGSVAVVVAVFID